MSPLQLATMFHIRRGLANYHSHANWHKRAESQLRPNSLGSGRPRRRLTASDDCVKCVRTQLRVINGSVIAAGTLR